MEKTTKELIVDIKGLLDIIESNESPAGKQIPRKLATKKITGCSGSLQVLVNEGFFNQSKTLNDVLDEFKRQGQGSFGDSLVSMNLLNLVKPPKKALSRNKVEGQWRYVLARK